jgi:hypothetical protein
MKEHRQQIKLAWRAMFQQPIGPMNPLGAKMLLPIEVEIRQSNGIWKCYRPGTKEEMPIAGQPLASTLKRQIEGVLFQKRLSEWQAYNIITPTFVLPLKPDEFTIDDQERAWKKDTTK